MDTVEYIELFWDCPECGQTHISAVFNPQGNRCPSCLHWRLDAIALYEAPDSQIVTDPALINRPPFWVCKVCDAVNPDGGVVARLLQCENCNSHQTSEIGAISGDQIQDQQAPTLVALDVPVKLAASTPQKLPRQPARSTNDPIVAAAVGISAVILMGASVVGGSIWSGVTRSTSPVAIAPSDRPVAIAPSDATLLQVQVTDLRWVVETDVEEQKAYEKESWRSQMPSNGTVLKSETRENTRSEQRGFQTVMVPEKYQSGTRNETYTEAEKYQSGTTTKTDYTSERYQSGTTNESYSESERYQSGTEQKCQTTSSGNGLGRRSCSSVPVYSTRQVSRSRSVPTYSTRQVPRTQSLPVYSTRQVERTRSVPVYSTRELPVKEPIFVTIPFSDTWVSYQIKEWAFKQTRTDQGKDDTPRKPSVKIVSPQRTAATRMKCRLEGRSSEPEWGQQGSRVQVWLPCEDYDRVKIGNWVQLRPSGVDSANLVSIL